MIYIANWKMGKVFEEEINFCITHKQELTSLALKPNTQLIICPSALSLYSIATIFKKSTLAVGAQICSPHESGAYTGQISARSLKQAGATYCMVGHSEQRSQGASDAHISQQIHALFKHDITPIICLGEQYHNDDAETSTALSQQLEAIAPLLKDNKKLFFIAYEPVWAIGTGEKPEISHLEKTASWLRSKITLLCGNNANYKLLYGGSIDPLFTQQLKALPGVIDGFLIGNASLDFKKFEKIVL
jgi:Triosephosphate isomerase